VIEWIRTRRSIREYRDEPVPAEQVALLEETALRSPTSHGKRSWEFVFVDERETIRRLAGLKPQGAALLAGAPLAVVVAGDAERSDAWIEDASIATILMQMTAHSLGLGSCWVHVRNRRHDDRTTSEEYVRGLLGIPDRLKVLAVLAVGRPAERKEPVPADRLDRGKIHRNRYGPAGSDRT